MVKLLRAAFLELNVINGVYVYSITNYNAWQGDADAPEQRPNQARTKNELETIRKPDSIKETKKLRIREGEIADESATTTPDYEPNNSTASKPVANKPTKHPPSADALALADGLRLALITYDAEHTVRQPHAWAARRDKWASEFDLLLRRDGKTVDRAIEVLEWAVDDAYWGPRIQDPKKLRKHFDAIYADKSSARASNRERRQRPRPALEVVQ